MPQTKSVLKTKQVIIDHFSEIKAAASHIQSTVKSCGDSLFVL